jgi:nitrile hydratase accessory protein
VSDEAKVDLNVTNMAEAIAVPRKNGELQFDAPWQARAFGLAVALNEEGAYPWADFSVRLSEVIAEGERSEDPAAYYDQWLRALETVAVEKGLFSATELVEKMNVVEAEDDHDHAGHDHDGHGHHHDH